MRIFDNLLYKVVSILIACVLVVIQPWLSGWRLIWPRSIGRAALNWSLHSIHRLRR